MKALRELHMEADSKKGENGRKSKGAHARSDQVYETKAQRGGLSKRLYTLKEAGVYIGLSHWSIRSLIYSGQLAYVRLGRRILIDQIDLDGLIDARKQQGRIR
jgi:excisionase family DNA binding protein